MNKLLLVFLLLVLVSLASTHRHKHGRKGKGGVKKIVKVFNNHHHHHHGPRGPAPTGKPASSSSSSSSSSEEAVPDLVLDNEEVKTTLAAPPPTTTTTITTTTTTKPPPKCDEGWLSFSRPHGLWCVYVGNKGGNNHQLTQPEAEKICDQHHATLTGLYNNEERMEVAKEAIHQLGEINVEMGAVWLGAKTRDACKTTSCGPANTFEWTDGSTNSDHAFQWGVDEPDNESYPGNHACIQQIVMTSTFVPANKEEEEMKKKFKHGDLDKYKCESPEHPKTRLYACGRKAM